MKVVWYGHSAFKVEINGKTFFVDPWLTNPKSPLRDLNGLNPDYILVTHSHGDHLGDTIQLLKMYPQAKAVAIFELANYIASEINDTSRVVDGNIGGPIDLGDGYFAVLTTATHSSDKGAPTGVVFGKGEDIVYHAGDTGLTSDMALLGELYKPKLALLPIGGHYTMGPKEAAKAAELIRPKYVIPMHYGTFPVIKGSPDEFTHYLKALAPYIEVIIPGPGEEIEIK